MALIDRVRTLLDYDSMTGDFSYRADNSRRKAGESAGSKNSEGYIVIRVAGVKHYAHRLAFLMVHGRLPVGVVDHINGNKSDNRITNLREATHSANQLNRHRPPKHNKSGAIGVYHRGDRWIANICINGRTKHLGIFSTQAEAVAARTASTQND